MAHSTIKGKMRTLIKKIERLLIQKQCVNMSNLESLDREHTNNLRFGCHYWPCLLPRFSNTRIRSLLHFCSTVIRVFHWNWAHLCRSCTPSPNSQQPVSSGKLYKRPFVSTPTSVASPPLLLILYHNLVTSHRNVPEGDRRLLLSLRSTTVSE